MHVQVRRDGGVDRVQEAAELLGAVPRRHVGDEVAGGDVQGGVQVGGAVADVVVRPALGHARHERQHRGGAVERLDLRLLVHAQNDRGLGRVQVQGRRRP
jgi:hypothetical protein